MQGLAPCPGAGIHHAHPRFGSQQRRHPLRGSILHFEPSLAKRLRIGELRPAGQFKGIGIAFQRAGLQTVFPGQPLLQTFPGRAKGIDPKHHRRLGVHRCQLCIPHLGQLLRTDGIQPVGNALAKSPHRLRPVIPVEDLRGTKRGKLLPRGKRSSVAHHVRAQHPPDLLALARSLHPDEVAIQTSIAHYTIHRRGDECAVGSSAATIRPQGPLEDSSGVFPADKDGLDGSDGGFRLATVDPHLRFGVHASILSFPFFLHAQTFPGSLLFSFPHLGMTRSGLPKTGIRKRLGGHRRRSHVPQSGTCTRVRTIRANPKHGWRFPRYPCRRGRGWFRVPLSWGRSLR